MSEPLVFDRFRKLPPPEKADGTWRCRNCRGPALTKKAGNTARWPNHYCSAACMDSALVATSASYARAAVYARDRGVCASCGMDTEYVLSTLNPLLREACDRWMEPVLCAALRQRVADVLLELGFSPAIARRAAQAMRAVMVHLWEANHRLAVAEGGGGATLEHLETLCRVCHGKHSKAVVGRLAKTKRLVKREQRHRDRMAAKDARFTPAVPGAKTARLAKKESRHEARMLAKLTGVKVEERDWRGRWK